ncbi:MAG: mRNA-degrading endonuclease [Leptolyngbya sp.]|nr:MAG: mRNA-degrading endonuclease [Leptolyngbya sp.]
MVVTAAYIPDSGDLVWLDFNPQTGREQANRRPAVVLSPASYNGKVKLGIFCPITTKVKSYPFEVALPDDLPIAGVILADQVKSLDWQIRKAEFICKAPDSVMAEVSAKLKVLLPSPSANQTED